MKDLEKRVDSYLEYGYEFLGKLIKCASVLDEYKENSDAPFGIENKKALETLLEKGKNDGFNVGNVDNYAGYVEFGSGDTLGILAHLDVVPVVKDEWKTNPFELVFNGDKMYGRGTTDDKGPLVASYVAMKMLKDEGFKPNMKIRLIAGCDEESGSRCMERYLRVEGEPKMAFSPDASFPLIYGEKAMLSYDILGDLGDDVIITLKAGERYNIVPSKAEMTLKVDLKKEFLNYLKENNYKGEIVDDKYIAYGIASHAMAPDNGLNAIYILFDFLSKNSNSKLAKFIDEFYLWDNHGKKADYYIYDEEMKDLTSNMAVADIKDGKIRLGVNCRCPLDECLELIPNALSKITSKYGYSYKIVSGSKRHYVSKESELVQKLLKAYRSVTNDNSEPITIGGGTYAREMTNAVAFGPCMPYDEDVCHISNEYMTLESFKNAIMVYYLAIKDLAK